MLTRHKAKAKGRKRNDSRQGGGGGTGSKRRTRRTKHKNYNMDYSSTSGVTVHATSKSSKTPPSKPNDIRRATYKIAVCVFFALHTDKNKNDTCDRVFNTSVFTHTHTKQNDI